MKAKDAGIEDPRDMQIKRVCSQSLEKGPAEYFTGSVRCDQLFDTPEPARVFIVNATFEPGARQNS